MSAPRSPGGPTLRLQARPLPRADGGELAHHLPRAPIGCGLLLTHVIGGGAPRPGPRPCGLLPGRAFLRAVRAAPSSPPSAARPAGCPLRSGRRPQGGSAALFVPWLESPRAAPGGQCQRIPPAKVLLPSDTPGARALPGRSQPSDFGVSLGDVHFVTPMMSLFVPNSENRDWGL